MKPVQTGLKTLVAGTVCAAAIWSYTAASRVMYGPPDASLKTLIQCIPRRERELRNIWERDPETIELLLRLESFRRFGSQEYDDVVMAFAGAICHDSEKNAVGSFYTRARYQTVIEAARVFRAIIEFKVSTALEDFDEIAVDINAKVEQVCSDAIQDTYV